MAEPFKKWTVLPHGKLTALEENLLTVVGDLPLLHLTGPKPQIAGVVRLRIKDKRALREQLEAWARLQGLRRIVPSHGDVVDSDPPAVLRDLAHSLAA